MAPLWRKNKSNQDDAADASEGEALRRDIEQRLQQDPCWQVLTFDALSWIDPISGVVVSAPFDWRAEACKHLLKYRDCRRRRLLSMEQLRALRWTIFMEEELRNDRRLRLFNDAGQWLNPVTGTWSEQVRREGTTVTMACVEAMAAELGQSEATPRDLQAMPLLLRIQAQQRHPATDKTEQQTTRVHVRPSGRLLASVVGDKPEEAERIANKSGGVESWLRAVANPPHVTAAVLSRPLEEVGGDCCLFEELADGRTFLLLADASGHGSEAAKISAAAVRLARAVIAETQDLRSIILRLNAGLVEELTPGRFLTGFAACYDPHRAELECCCAGHHHGLIANPTTRQVLRRVGHHGMALGIRAGQSFERTVRSDTVHLQPGDTLFCYTDGLCEAANGRGAQLGHWGAIACFIGHIERAPSRIIAKMLAQLCSYNENKFDDDLTMLVFRYNGPAEGD